MTAAPNLSLDQDEALAQLVVRRRQTQDNIIKVNLPSDPNYHQKYHQTKWMDKILSSQYTGQYRNIGRFVFIQRQYD